MHEPSLAQRERAELCDLLEELGPDAPTLDEGWTTADLAAHLVVRERDPRTGPGIVLRRGRAAALTARLQAAEKAKGYEAVVARVRSGPPWWWKLPGVDGTAGLNEFFLHHEDVRRANGRGRRVDRPDLDAALWRLLRFVTRMQGRRVRPAGLELRTPDGGRLVVRKGPPSAVLTGAPSELVLYLAGRRSAAELTLEGDPAAIDVVRAANLSL